MAWLTLNCFNGIAACNNARRFAIDNAGNLSIWSSPTNYVVADGVFDAPHQTKFLAETVRHQPSPRYRRHNNREQRPEKINLTLRKDLFTFSP